MASIKLLPERYYTFRDSKPAYTRWIIDIAVGLIFVFVVFRVFNFLSTILILIGGKFGVLFIIVFLIGILIFIFKRK